MTLQALRQRKTGTYRRAPAGVEEEVCSVGRCGRLIGDGPMAQGHAHNGRHVSLSAKHMDGDPSGLPCEGRKSIHGSSLLISALQGRPHDSGKAPLEPARCPALSVQDQLSQEKLVVVIFTIKQNSVKVTCQ